MVARVLVSAFILLLAGGVVFLMFHDPAPVCSICNRPILDATTCTVTLVKGDVVPLCCPRCTMRFEQDRDDVKSTEVSDFYSGEKLPITGAVYVEGSQVHPCCDHKGVQMDRSGAQYEMTWDRCLPSLIAFKSPEDASEFSLMYGGKVRTFGDLKVGRPESEEPVKVVDGATGIGSLTSRDRGATMDCPEFDKLIKDFFTCDRQELTAIFDEYLSVMEADMSLAPGGLMSRNYETAQANPEINTIPGNLKDARDAIFPFFWGTDEWFSRLHLENVKGPANYASLIGAIACLLKNPNLCVDTYSQRSNELEVKAATSLANLIFYHTDSPWGVFTMGGTISNLYGGKIGIEKVCPGAMAKGLQGCRLVGIVSEAAHYSNRTLAGWLGIGTENLHAVSTDKSFAMQLDHLEELLDRLYGEEKTVAFVIATFGSTDASGVDDVSRIRKIIEEKASQYNKPVPQLHVDAAVGWVLSLLTEYDTAKNPFRVDEDVIPLILRAQELSKGLMDADSVTIDFHKMGWGHYPSSAFIVNRRTDLRYLFRTKSSVPYFSEAEYRRDPALFTLECSRPAIGPYSVMASLNGIGLKGYQMLVAHSLEIAHFARKKIDELDYCKVLNADTIGATVLWWVLPKGRDAKKIYDRLVSGKLSENEYKRYFTEIKHLFDKRSESMDIRKDARLSFTSSIGYSPHGVRVPAWKAVFFNPKTDRHVVEQVIRSIEDL